MLIASGTEIFWRVSLEFEVFFWQHRVSVVTGLGNVPSPSRTVNLNNFLDYVVGEGRLQVAAANYQSNDRPLHVGRLLATYKCFQVLVQQQLL